MSKSITQKCKVENCVGKGHVNRVGKISFTKGLCGKHYKRLWKHGDIAYERPMRIEKCKVIDCDKPGKMDYKRGKRYFTKGYCMMHYGRLIKNGSVGEDILKIIRNGKRSNSLYPTYASMKDRCYNINNKSYHNYGGRGIKVCHRWLGKYGFDNFISDMGKKPSPNHSLDRIDNNSSYEPNNCRWATIHQQAANKRNNNNVVGVSYCKLKNTWNASLTINNNKFRKNFLNETDAIFYANQIRIKYLK